VAIRAEARVQGATLLAGTTIDYDLREFPFAYVAPASGSVIVNGQHVKSGDGIAAIDESHLNIVAETDAEIVLVEAA
jgi:redox-sensitive bicupin YhaK (pirin superfamily)